MANHDFIFQESQTKFSESTAKAILPFIKDVENKDFKTSFQNIQQSQNYE